jgi:hypothetical protein
MLLKHVFMNLNQIEFIISGNQFTITKMFYFVQSLSMYG